MTAALETTMVEGCAFSRGMRLSVAGNTYNGTDYDALVLRYDADGVVDEDFGNGGCGKLQPRAGR